MKDYQQPDPSGHFGIYGGSFVSETLTHAINDLKHQVVGSLSLRCPASCLSAARTAAQKRLILDRKSVV